MDRYLAIVTARSGSKRLPGKNIRNLCGKPLFVWSVMAALECQKISRTIVSTDCHEYRNIAIEAGADCPWLRDKELSGDSASSVEVVLDVLKHLRGDINQYRGLILLQPTSPLRNSLDINGAIQLFEYHNAPAVVSVSETECPPYWMGQLKNSLLMDEFTPTSIRNLSTQNLNVWHRINGAIYIIDINKFIHEKDFIPKGTLAYQMPRERSVDVDTQFDFDMAELLLLQGGKIKN